MKTYVIIPTFNEVENIEKLIREILDLRINGLSTVVIDDNSPDGTGELVNKLSKYDPRIKTIIRIGKRGRGRAGITGLRYALSQGADYIIEMDADFSHSPEYIPQFLSEIGNYDLIVGSRFVNGGEDRDRGVPRKIITRLAGIYSRYFLGLKIRDVSSGFRCFRKEVFEKISLDDLISTGPSIVLELLYKITSNGFRVKEMPIIFRNRRHGRTKFNCITLLRTMFVVLKLRRTEKLCLRH